MRNMWTASLVVTILLGAVVLTIGPATAHGSIRYDITYEGPRDAAAVQPLLKARLVALGSGYGYGYGYGYGTTPPSGSDGHGYGYGYGYGDGGPTFGDLAAGDYRILAFADLDHDGAPTMEEPTAPGEDAQGNTLIHLTDGQQVRMQAVVREAPSTVTGRVVSDDGTPVAGATVAITDRFGWALPPVTTDAAGAFAFPDAPAGVDHVLHYAAHASAEGYHTLDTGLAYAVTRDAYDMGDLALTPLVPPPPADVTPPTVVSHAPEGSNVDTGSSIVVAFSEPMDHGSVNVTILPHVGTTATWNGPTLTLAPITRLAADRSYVVLVHGGARDLAGNPMASEHAWIFTTAPPPDTDAPRVLSHQPSGNDVALSAPIRVTFSEPMNASSVRLTTSPRIDGALSWSGATLTFTPAAPLASATQYSVRVAGGKDVAGNAMAADHAWSFQTRVADADRPHVVSALPTGDHVVSSAAIVLAFDRPMDAASVASALAITPTPSGDLDKFSHLAWSGNTLSILAEHGLDPRTHYTVTLAGSATSLAGIQMGAPYAWSFTVAPAAPPPPPVTDCDQGRSSHEGRACHEHGEDDDDHEGSHDGDQGSCDDDSDDEGRDHDHGPGSSEGRGHTKDADDPHPKRNDRKEKDDKRDGSDRKKSSDKHEHPEHADDAPRKEGSNKVHDDDKASKHEDKQQKKEDQNDKKDEKKEQKDEKKGSSKEGKRSGK